MTATMCMIPTFWSVVAGNQLLYNTLPVPFLTLTMQFPIIVAIFFLNFFSDAKPKYIELEGKKLYFNTFVFLMLDFLLCLRTS